MDQQEVNARAESAEGKSLIDSDIPSIIAAYEEKNPLPKEKPEKQWILCAVGLVGVGKTSLLKRLSADLHLARVCNDDIRILLRNHGFNFLRTIDIARALVHKYAKERWPIALDGDSIIPEHREEIARSAKERGAPLVFVHITAPEEVVFARRRAATYGPETFFQNAEQAIFDYHRRKPLHDKYLSEINFDYSFDTSSPSLSERIEDFEILMKKRGF